MKRFILSKSMLCLFLLGMVCNVAWADFTQKWTKSPVGPWGTTDLTAEQYPVEVGTNLVTAQGDKTGTVRKAEVKVTKTLAGDVTILFTYDTGGHKLNILGVDLVGADGKVKYSDYHYGKAPGDGTTNDYTLKSVAAGDYTLRYFVCNNSNDEDKLTSTIGNITVTGLIHQELLYNVTDGKYNDRSGSNWRNGWVSTNINKPSLNISVSNNNVNAGCADYIGLRPGDSGCTYTITTGVQIKSLSFEAITASTSNETHVITIGGVAKNVGTDWTEFTIDNINSTSTTFQMGGNANKNSYDCLVRNIKITLKEDAKVNIVNANDFVNGGVYTFVTGRGWVGANDGDNAIGTVKTSVTPAASASNAMFQWTVYKSKNGNYYLYNIGKEKFLGAASNGVFPFVDAPDSKVLSFKNSSWANYPIMFSPDNKNAVSQNANSGLFAWSGGWTNLNDEGSNHKVMLVNTLTDAELEAIANIVEDYDKSLAVQVAVDGWTANNPNTHFGNVTATQGETVSTTKLTTKNMNVSYMMYNNVSDIISFTRPYRGFNFQGFYVGEESLGKSFELTEDLKNSITEANPLIAKFTATSDVTLFYDDDPKSYRIPAITTTGTGRIFAVSDYRHNLDDIGRDKHNTGTMRIDLVTRYSDNNGQTWSETQTIAAGDNSQTGSYLRAFGDAAIAAVGQNIVVMAAAGDQLYPYATTASPNRMARIFSSDNGVNWTKSEMTTKMYNSPESLIPNGVAAFFGSGKMVVDANFNDTQKARIYGALLVRTYIDGTYDNYNNYVVYSDDLGETWAILGGSQTPIAKGDEPKVEILPNGQILLSARRGGGRVFNVFTYTDKANNAGTWDTAANGCDNGGSNATNGEIFCVDAKKVDGTAVKLLMQSQPKGGGSQYDRKDVTIWYKEIDANTTYTTTTIKGNWTEGLQVSHQQSSYSAVTMQPNGKIAFFFEEAPCYADNYEKGYSMVYVPLTIENITKGNYFAPSTNLDETRTINVKLTDAEGNVYNDVIESTIATVAEAVSTKYSFITLGANAGFNVEGETYTYTNSVTLPFKVSNGETTIWHNIYFPSFNKPDYNPIYLSAELNNETVKTCKENVPYGQSSFNTLDYADEISWAIYQSGNGFNFKFKNKLVDKYIKATEVGNTSNTVFDEESNATTFEIMSVPEGNNRKAGYALKAIVGGKTGYLSCTSSNNGYATHYGSHEHAGGRVHFVEAPDFEALIAEVNAVLNLFGNGLGQYSNVSEENLNAVNAAKEVMANASSVNKSVLDTYKTYEEKTDGATLNMPQPGQYFRVAYDYGGSVGKLYMQGVTSTVKGVKFTEETGNASVWVYNDGTLTSYYDGRNLREVDDNRGLSDTKTTVTFSESTRAKGKYNIACTSYIHANSNGSNYFTDHCNSNNHATHDLILEEAEVAVEDVFIADWEIGTFYANGAMAIPEGLSAYVATAEPVMEGETGVITLTKIQTGVIPAKTGVIITGKFGYYDFTSVTSDASVGENFMCGYAGPEAMQKVTLTNDASYYILTVVNNTPGFYKKAYDFNVYNNKAYLKLPTTVAASLRFRFNNNDGTTDIIEVPTEALNGNVGIYDLSGRRVEKAGKGVYIVNGKKVIF